MIDAAFKGLELTPEIERETVAYIESLMDKDFEYVNNLSKSNGQHCSYIMKFFQMKEKTDLHRRFREKFLDPLRKIKEKAEEGRILGLMKNNKELFIQEHLIDSYQYNDVKYQIIKKYYVKYKDKDYESLTIAIPYFSSQAARDKFGYGIIINRKDTPELFDRLVKDMKVYSGNAVLTSNKK